MSMATEKFEEVETPYGTVRTDWGQLLCPQKQLAEIADVEESGTVRVCGMPLYIGWHASVPVTLGDALPLRSAGAVTSVWRLECEEGHVLARSDSQEECPDAPLVSSLLPLIAG